MVTEFLWERRDRLLREFYEKVYSGKYQWINGPTGYYLRRVRSK